MHRTINRTSCGLKQIEVNTIGGNQFKIFQDTIQKEENRGAE